MKLLLDSGSPGLYVVQRVAQRCGFAPLAERVTFGGGGTKRHVVQRGLFDRLALGELHFERALATVAKREVDRGSAGSTAIWGC